MQHLAPVGDVYQAGTLSGNPLATAAGLSRAAPAPRPGRLRGARAKGRAAGGRPRPSRTCPARRRNVDALLPRLRPGSDPVTDFAQASACDTSRYAEYFRHMLDRGVYVPPSQYEAMFVSLAHGDEEIDRTVEAAAELRRKLDLWQEIALDAEREGSLWKRGAAAARRPRPRAGLLAADRLALRDRRRDDLRGLPRPLRSPAALRARRRRHGAPARRLPVRAGARPALGRRLGRGGRRHGRADLALRPAPRRALGRRRPGLGRERRAARPGRAQGDRGFRASFSRARARRPATRRSSARSRPTPGASVKVGSVLAAALVLADAATEGKKVIFGMLITGLVLVALPVLGETYRYFRYYRHGRSPSH